MSMQDGDVLPNRNMHNMRLLEALKPIDLQRNARAEKVRALIGQMGPDFGIAAS